MAKRPFLNIVSGAHEGSRSVVFSVRTLRGRPPLTVGMLVCLWGGGKYDVSIRSQERESELVFETDETQSSGTITTVWGFGEFETNVYAGSPEPGDYLFAEGGKLARAGNDTEKGLAKWLVVSKAGDVIRFRTI